MFSQWFSSFTVPRLPPSFSFDLVQVAEQQVELCWSDLLALIYLNISSFEVFLQYREETNGELFRGERLEGRLAHRTESRRVAKKVVEVPISLSSRGVTVAGLSPGSIYSFTLRAAHLDGSSWTLGQTQTAYTSSSPLCLGSIHTYTHTEAANTIKMSAFFFTGPPSPQNITVGAVTTDQIQVHWTLPVALFDMGWMFLVRFTGMSNDQNRTVGMTKISRISETNPLRSHTAVIGGLESHRKYRIEVSTVTKHGIESCEQAAVVVQTGKHVTQEKQHPSLLVIH